MDIRDWFLMGSIGLLQVAATVFLFYKPTTENFVTWAGIAATLSGTYHWLVIRDSKMQDADNVPR
jgi:hypothetical protein